MTIPSKLWKPQIDACNLIHKYILDFQNGITKASFLTKMPTGTGKTGVMATISHEVPEIKSVLVVCPRSALRSQLHDEISNTFFNKISHTSKKLKKTIKLLSGNSFEESFLDKIVVTTIQKLNSTRKNEPTKFNSICKKFDLIIFDEGHYEPATNWSKSIREIESPKIIFTATPFRNDFKTFEFDSKYVFSIKHKDCEKLNILRKPNFVSLKKQSDPVKFVKAILKEFNKIKLKKKDAKLIIRCDDYQSILKISTAVKSAGETFVAIHERFNPGTYSWGFKKVPPISTKANVWIHQYKLLEGIDDPNFMVLATFNPIKNSRQLIQQIGRILRNVKLLKNQKALILDSEDGIHESMWKLYLEYDDLIDQHFGKTYGDTLKEALGKLPNIEYIDKSFRKNYLKESKFNLNEDIFIPLSTNILTAQLSTSSSNIETLINQYHVEKDYSSTFHRINSTTGVHLYISYTSSPILAKHFFFDINLNVCIHKISKDKILFYDSKGVSLSTYLPDNGIRPLNAKSLKKLISQRNKSRLVNLSLKNSVLSNNSITGHSYSAISIQNTAPYLDDNGQIISSIVGYSKENPSLLFKGKDTFRRYIGLSKGRLTQSNSRFNFKIYLEWLKEIVKIVEGSGVPNITFKRYATETIAPSVVKPLNILLDFSEILEIKFQDGSGQIDTYEVISKVKDIGGRYFTKINLDSKEYDIEIKYDPIKQIFMLESDEISKNFWNEDKQDIIQYFNSNQAFRIVTDKKNLMYAFGTFFNPQLKTGSTFNEKEFQLRNIIIPVKELNKKFINEKGRQCQPRNIGWDKDSMFHLIDTLGTGTVLKNEFVNTEILICDDMGTEVADFILCTKTTVAFIHVKGIGNKDTSKVS